MFKELGSLWLLLCMVKYEGRDRVTNIASSARVVAQGAESVIVSEPVAGANLASRARHRAAVEFRRTKRAILLHTKPDFLFPDVFAGSHSE